MLTGLKLSCIGRKSRKPCNIGLLKTPEECERGYIFLLPEPREGGMMKGVKEHILFSFLDSRVRNEGVGGRYEWGCWLSIPRFGCEPLAFWGFGGFWGWIFWGFPCGDGAYPESILARMVEHFVMPLEW